ncbi:MAG: histidinol dehydrogenase, partial [Bacteroidales bacterium]|nr:histidinol dehydrogenase [Bacteroidales bacterium]
MGEIVKLYVHPDRKEWMEIMSRSKAEESAQVTEIVAGIIDKVKARGDEALREYELRFDRARLESFRVSKAEIEDAERLVPEHLKAAIAQAQKNIAAFHSAQLMQPVTVETTPGVVCEQRQVAIESVGLYVPGGNSPLFSTVLMLAVPAAIAGCSRRVLCTPPGADGKVNAAILYAASLAGVEEIYKVGGAQAIAA